MAGDMTEMSMVKSSVTELSKSALFFIFLRVPQEAFFIAVLASWEMK